MVVAANATADRGLPGKDDVTMMKALFSAIAGVRNHITFMDVVGNNLANVNTTGYKASRVTFQDMLSQTLTGASAATATNGGTNPVQVGLGMKVGGIDVSHLQGSLQASGKLTDFAVQGNGFFLLRDGARTFYTRDGAFEVSVTGQLVNPTNGLIVQGWNASSSGVVDTTTPIGGISVPFGQSVSAQSSTQMTIVGNLDSRLTPADSLSTTVNSYDSLGQAYPVQLTFTPTANPNEWDVTATSADANVTGLTVNAADTPMTFNASGGVTNPAVGSPLRVDITLAAATGATTPIATSINTDSITQFAAEGQIAATFNNGYAAGQLVSFSVGPSGDITGIFSNGINQPIGQLAMSLFVNPAGLLRGGNNTFEESVSSGVPITGTPGTGGRGSIAAGVLEGSNTDLAREFTNMVVAQRGFQASSRVISTADEMLSDLVNLKR